MLLHLLAVGDVVGDGGLDYLASHLRALKKLKGVDFTVVNESQKKWIEERILHDLEGKIRKASGSTRLRLTVSVLPDEKQKVVKYLPEEKAQDLMSHNEEVKNLITDFHLGVK